ncbi:membrane-bound alkaline phosphatase-like [Maniola jurtina]|uniref:membrane-bound alkaline phosphatase-like n=1 Tax=Maniola jurtina TaxID=191418 RepID=UPI001E686E12|nr:membrane-bound alkaline phosphatase-like [Maniola jurtina]XP_045772644.1 membrane-bound alkaline phosphatase-like [Maniola jurtina]
MLNLKICRTFLFLLCVVYSNGRNLLANKDDNLLSSRSLFDEKNKDHWKIQAQWTLRTKLDAPLNTKVAKNVILFLGDGMSIPTLAATRVYLGRKYGQTGEELKLSFETFPFTGLAKTYCVDHNVADSACSGTAYFSGVKANSGTLGLSGAVKRGDCEGQKDSDNAVTGLMDWAQRAGKSTGIVTTTRVTHASPAAAYAHSADRKWEADADLPRQGLRCEDIASQLVRGRVGSHIDVVFGGGRKNFYSRKDKDANGNFGYRKDGRNLIREWLAKKESQGVYPKYIENRRDLLKLDKKQYGSVLGLFASDHLPYNLEADIDDPSLSEMTQKAIEILSQNQNGYFLFVEGGRIDTAHHETKAQKALDETAELAKAVEAALRMVDPDNTLIVVTSDHSHTMSYSGYSKRGSDILGLANVKYNASDNLPYSTLSYANGPGYKPHSDFKRHNLMLDDMNNLNYTFPSMVPIARETHGGDDVAVFAKGPWAHLFTGNYEQNFIPHAIAYASCIGPGLTKCKL